MNANYTTPSPERPATDSKADSNEEALLDSAETKGTPQMLRDLSKRLTKQYKALKPSQSLTSSSSSKSRIDSQDSIPSKEGTNHKSCSHQGQDSSHQIQDSSHQGLGQDTSHQDTNCQNQDASHQWCSSWQSQAHPIWIVICSQCAKTRKEAKMQRVQEGDRL